MLGKFVRVQVTAPIHSVDEATGFTYQLNYGEIRLVTSRSKSTLNAFVMGIDRPIRVFDGVVIASLYKDGKATYVVAPKSRKYIIHDVKKATAFFEPESIRCYYEHSCGAVVQRTINGQDQYLLIKNKRSAHWSFPKGHIEEGESNEQTAKREVLEETGTHIKIVSGFQKSSTYNIQNRISKTVILFAATTKDRKTVNQEAEIEASEWLPYEAAYQRLKFENDKKILAAARRFLLEKQGKPIPQDKLPAKPQNSPKANANENRHSGKQRNNRRRNYHPNNKNRNKNNKPNNRT